MVEDYVPDRLEFELASSGQERLEGGAGRGHARRPLSSMARRPPSLELEGEMVIAPAAERAGFAGYQFGARRRSRSRASRQHARRPARRPTQRQGHVHRRPRQAAGRPRVRSRRRSPCGMAEAGGRAVERKLTLPVDADGADDRRQAAVLRPLARRGRERGLRRRSSSRPTASRSPRSGLRYELLQGRDAAISGIAATAAGNSSR